MPGVRLGVEEREAIGLGVARDEGFAEIARRMARPTSTVAREVNRNGGRAMYRASAAQKASVIRSRRPKVPKLVTNTTLASVVAEGLVKRWSPAEVAARVVLDHPDDPEMRVSHETIYTSLYLQGKGGLKRELIDEGRAVEGAHDQVAFPAAIDVYFCDPHSPWQRALQRAHERVASPVLPERAPTSTTSAWNRSDSLPRR